MISEKQFASEFSGFWAETLPYLNPQAIAELNLRASSLGEGRRTWIMPMANSEDNSNNDFIAETAFGLFAESLKSESSISELMKDAERVRCIEQNAMNRVLALRREVGGMYNANQLVTGQSVELGKRLETYFSLYSPNSIVIQPWFRGCGVLDSCYGDVIAGKSLFELKMVGRNLRSADIRQILVYCALNYRSAQYLIDKVTILNPRRGLEFSFVVEELTERASGRNASDLFHIITTFLSDFEAVHLSS